MHKINDDDDDVKREQKVLSLIEMLCRLASLEGYTITKLSLKVNVTGRTIK